MKPGTAHKLTMKARKKTALEEASHAAEFLGSDGKPLKQKRTGKKLDEALVREMKQRGYKRTRTASGWQRMTHAERFPRR